jgi:high-affinity iron transporter
MGAFVVTLREGFEASLIVGLIFAYLVKTGQREHIRIVWLGTASAAVAGAFIGAILFLAVGELEGLAEQLYEGTAMLIAAGVLTWMVFWMRRQARTLAGHLRAQVSEAIRSGSAAALAMVAFVAVGREGVETALFLFAATKEAGAATTVIGGIVGLAGAVGLGVLLYRGAIAIDLRKFFTVTGMLVIVLAAYLLFSGMHEFGEAASGDLLELVAPLLGLLYGVGFSWLYLHSLRRIPARA